MPSAVYFAHWLHHGTITLEAHEHYQKRTWRNKTAILGPNAPIPLTVPLQKGKHQQMMIRDVRIAYHEPWAQHHLNSIQTIYGKTAFYDELRPGLELILKTGFDTLWELNLHLLDFLTDLIRHPWSYRFSELYEDHYPETIVDLRGGIPAGIIPPGVDQTPEYRQVHRLVKTHMPNLCILDALCHLGPATEAHLRLLAEKLYAST